jgi:cardiolipin synthase
MPPIQIPNLITAIRILLVAPTAWLLWQGAYVEALVLMAIASVSDAVDGWLARRFNWVTRFGEAMDPVADKLLVGTLFVVFTLQDHIPIWLAVIVLGRDVVILAGVGVYRLMFEQIEFAPTFLSKANTAMQIIMLLLMLVSLCALEAISPVAGALIDPYCFWILAVLGVTSGMDYVVTWGLRAWRNVYPTP